MLHHVKKRIQGKKKERMLKYFTYFLSTFCSPFVEFFFIYYDKKNIGGRRGQGEGGELTHLYPPIFFQLSPRVNSLEKIVA